MTPSQLTQIRTYIQEAAKLGYGDDLAIGHSHNATDVLLAGDLGPIGDEFTPEQIEALERLEVVFALEDGE